MEEKGEVSPLQEGSSGASEKREQPAEPERL